MEIAMPSKVKPARRKGFFHWLWREFRIATAFALSALLTYCSVGEFGPGRPPTQIAASP
jgi:hypothetical protein